MGRLIPGRRKTVFFRKAAGELTAVFLLGTILTGILTGCGSSENGTAANLSQHTETELQNTKNQNTENSENREQSTEDQETAKSRSDMVSATPFVKQAIIPGEAFPTVQPDAPVRTDGIDGSFGIGSASFLQGRNILVSLFLTTTDTSFTEEEKENCLQRLKDAAIYIEESALEYGVETQLILDWSEEESQDLCMEKTVDFSTGDDITFMEEIDSAFAQWTEEDLSYEKLMQEYGAEGIATCMFVNAPGRSYAIVYDGEDNVRESLVMFVRNDKGAEETAAVYAHEILHVFGAHDLYRGEEYSRAVTDYIAETYPDEIMRSVKGEGKITEKISRITAYHLGWIDEIPETESFPELIR